MVNGTKKIDTCGVCGGNGDTCNLKAVYVRWGRKTCPSTAKLLFNGTAARYNKTEFLNDRIDSSYTFVSSNDGHSGGGYRRVCLPTWPGQSWEHTDGGYSGSYMYGAQYETSGYGASDLNSVHDYPVACAVCEATRGEAVMIPGEWSARLWTLINFETEFISL